MHSDEEEYVDIPFKLTVMVIWKTISIIYLSYLRF